MHRIPAMARTAGRLTLGILAALLACVALYLCLALAGSLIPANTSWTPPSEGVRIYVYTNGVHTGIVVPTVNDVQDWRGLAKASDLADPRYGAASHLLFGWGERRFYLNTPTWADLDPVIAAGSLLYGPRTLLHVDHVHDPMPGPDMRPLMISKTQYAQLTRQLKRYFRLDARGQSQPVSGYGPDDVFYESNGHYDLVRTCNAWTGAQLREIGVRVGIWTPFSPGVMRWFRD